VAVRGKNRRNGDSARNDQLVNKKSTRGMVIPWRISSTCMDCSTGGIIIPPGIASSGMRNPPEEWDSAGNYQLIDKEFSEKWDSTGVLLARKAQKIL
jgi:hypothetical protein